MASSDTPKVANTNAMISPVRSLPGENEGGYISVRKEAFFSGRGKGGRWRSTDNSSDVFGVGSKRKLVCFEAKRVLLNQLTKTIPSHQALMYWDLNTDNSIEY